MRPVRSLVAVTLAALLCACPQGMPQTASLALTAHPQSIDDMGGSTMLQITALGADGLPGKGTVSLSAAAGVVTATSVTLDSNGAGTSSYSCNKAADMSCHGRVTLTATWTDQT